MRKTIILLCLFLSVDKSNAQSWQALPGGSLNGDVYSAIRFGPYMWFGGLFNNGGPVASPFIIRHDGFQWIATPFTNGVPVNFCIFNNELYAFGGFDIGPLRYGIMKWNGVGWTPLAQLSSGESIRSGTVYNGELVVGGRFTSINATSIEYIARYDGTNWYAFSGGPILCGWLVKPDINQVYAANNYLYVAGSFDKICGVNSSCTAKWDGTSWYALSIGTNTSASSFMSYGGNVYVSGTFQNAGPAASQGIAKEDTLTGDWTTVSLGNSGVMMDALTMSVWNGRLYIAGVLDVGSGVNIGNCGYWDGISWTPDHQGLNSNSLILSLYADPTTNVLYAGGTFNTQIGDTADYIVYKSLSSLPIELGSLDAICDMKHNCVELKWSTYSEHENLGFAVERSIDGYNFLEVVFVHGSGTSNLPIHYDFCDYEFPEGVCYYRLRQVDYNGENSVTKTLSVRCAREKQAIYVLSGHDVIHFGTMEDYELYDLAGRSVRKGESESLPLQGLVNGMYIIQFGDKRLVSRKVLKY